MIDTNPFPKPHINMVNLNWSEKEKRKLTVEIGPSQNKRVIKEALIRPKAPIIYGVVLCSKCRCECELEIAIKGQVLDEHLSRKKDSALTKLSKPSKEVYPVQGRQESTIFSRIKPTQLQEKLESDVFKGHSRGRGRGRD